MRTLNDRRNSRHDAHHGHAHRGRGHAHVCAHVYAYADGDADGVGERGSQVRGNTPAGVERNSAAADTWNTPPAVGAVAGSSPADRPTPQPPAPPHPPTTTRHFHHAPGQHLHQATQARPQRKDTKVMHCATWQHLQARKRKRPAEPHRSDTALNARALHQDGNGFVKLFFIPFTCATAVAS